MELNFGLKLPREAATVPFVRSLCRHALIDIGVTATCTDEVALAVTEACTNVVEHSTGVGDEYEVRVDIKSDCLEMRVIDTGHGFDFASLENVVATASDERGRGLLLMRALVDKIDFVSRPEAGTIVHFEKQLQLEPDSLLLRVRDPGRGPARPGGRNST